MDIWSFYAYIMIIQKYYTEYTHHYLYTTVTYTCITKSIMHSSKTEIYIFFRLHLHYMIF